MTYVYGDRADYNGLQDEARVYSKLVKVDGDATLYTRRFLFSRSTTGKFGTAAWWSKAKTVESDRGLCQPSGGLRQRVVRNEPTSSRGSVIYDLQTDHAYFFDNQHLEPAGDYLTPTGRIRKPTSFIRSRATATC
ncbi:MAG: hypothetical protein ACLS37_11135 [Alistipes sp.]